MSSSPAPNLFPDLQSIEATHNKLSMLVKGFSKVGKTYFMHSFPTPTFTVYTDPNRRTLVDLKARLGDQLDARVITTWSDYHNKIVPAVRGRKIPAETIIVDTFDFLAEMHLRELKGSGSMTQQLWGTFLDRMLQTTSDMTSATRPLGNHPGYNIIFSIHTKKITDESGNVTEIAPVMKGQFKDMLEAFFDFVVICEKQTKTIVGEKGQPPTKKRIFIVHTSPPSVKETAGAPSGFPPKLEIEEGENAYDLFADLWHPTSAQSSENDNNSNKETL